MLKETACLCIDIQETFLKILGSEASVFRRSAFAIESASMLEMPLLYTEQAPKKLGSTVDALIDAGLKHAKKFEKNTFSALKCENLKIHLQKTGIKHLVLIGLEASICIYQTLLDALKEGYQITLLSDCTEGRRKEDTQQTLNTISQLNCTILPSEAFFYSLLQSTTHPQFSRFTKIVKKYC